jgi:hypothetical protein
MPQSVELGILNDGDSAKIPLPLTALTRR